MKLKNIIGLFKKNKIIIIAFILLVSAYYFFNFKEGFGATSCTQFTNCSDCVNGRVTGSSSPCYWSSSQNKCGSFHDTGYSRTCPNPTPTPAPNPNPTPTPNPPCPTCPSCPKLTRLKNPTYITEQ